MMPFFFPERDTEMTGNAATIGQSAEGEGFQEGVGSNDGLQRSIGPGQQQQSQSTLSPVVEVTEDGMQTVVVPAESTLSFFAHVQCHVRV